MNRKFGFTLAEILICLTIIGVFAGFMMNSYRKINTSEKTNILNGAKAVALLEEASAKITGFNPTVCPMGTFMTEVVDTWELTTRTTAGVAPTPTSPLTSENVLDIFAEELKMQEKGLDLTTRTNINFGSFGVEDEDATAIKGARLAGGDIYIGFQVYDEIGDCPDVIIPGETTATTPKNFDGSIQKCWGQVFIDVNGTDGTGVLGEDVFTFGLGKSSIVK